MGTVLLVLLGYVVVVALAVAFIKGASVDPPNVTSVTSFRPRRHGSR